MLGGILAIGSLYWSDHSSRIKWRSSRLSKDKEVSVLVPIRYGRISNNWGKTYTMVFSLLCLRRSHGLGTAKAIPFMRDIETSRDLINEAEFLWAAERKQSNFDGTLSASWGSVALLVNPSFEMPNHLIDDWHARIANETSYGQISHTKSEPPVVSMYGCLRIPWPSTVKNDALDFDFLLATATDPTLKGDPPTYPRIRDIASAWKRDLDGNASYFWKNRESGIQTYQDDLILGYLG